MPTASTHTCTGHCLIAISRSSFLMPFRTKSSWQDGLQLRYSILHITPYMSSIAITCPRMYVHTYRKLAIGYQAGLTVKIRIWAAPLPLSSILVTKFPRLGKCMLLLHQKTLSIPPHQNCSSVTVRTGCYCGGSLVCMCTSLLPEICRINSSRWCPLPLNVYLKSPLIWLME